MCIVFLTRSKKYSLILASNRDEFLARPTARASFHAWSPALDAHSPTPTQSHRVLSGLDLAAGGTWLGVSFPPNNSTFEHEYESQHTEAHDRAARNSDRVVRIATLTNFTETLAPANPPRPSRGHLVKDFLDFDRRASVEAYLTRLEPTKRNYAGFNLLVAELRFPPTRTARNSLTVGYCSNREPTTKAARILAPFEPGASSVTGLSNATLEAEADEEVWPKVKSGCAAVERAVEEHDRTESDEAVLVEKLWETLSTPSLSQITHRSHLRHTVLVRPLSITPGSPLPRIPPPLPEPCPSSSSLSPLDFGDETEPTTTTTRRLRREGQDGTRWYATRTQTVVLVERETGRVVLREREGYRLGPDSTPEWVGDREPENVFEFTV